MTLSEPAAPAYDAYYYQHGCGSPYERTEAWLRFFGGIADQIVAGIAPHSALDAGCAMGFLVESLRDRGVEAYGLDISEFALAQVRQDIRAFTWPGSVLDPLPRRYDLIVCIEVLEHLPPGDAPQAVVNFCQHADSVLFSSTPSDFRETSHLNVRPVEYWAELFARQGFFRDVDFDASIILPWSALFRKRLGPLAGVARDYERKFWQLQNENQELHAALRAQNEQIRLLSPLVPQNEQLKADLASAHHLLEQITTSLGWRILQLLTPIRRFLVPPGSRRERLLQARTAADRPQPPAA